MQKTWIVALSFIVFSLPLFAKEIAIIELENRMGSELIEQVLPFLEPGGTARAFQDKIIVNTSASNLQALKSLIKQLDLPRHNLMISVSHAKSTPREEFHISATGEITFDGPAISVQGQHRTSREKDRSIHHIRVLSGESAFIETQITIPMIVQQGGYTGKYQGNQNLVHSRIDNQQRFLLDANRDTPGEILYPSQNPGDLIVRIGPSTDEESENEVLENETAPINFDSNDSRYQLQQEQARRDEALSQRAEQQSKHHGFHQQYIHRDLHSGIYVQPFLIGEKVKLSLSTVNQKESSHNSREIEGSSSQTHLSVPTGKWVRLGGSTTDSYQSKKGYNARTKDKEHQALSLWLRVDVIGEK